MHTLGPRGMWPLALSTEVPRSLHIVMSHTKLRDRTCSESQGPKDKSDLVLCP